MSESSIVSISGVLAVLTERSMYTVVQPAADQPLVDLLVSTLDQEQHYAIAALDACYQPKVAKLLNALRDIGCGSMTFSWPVMEIRRDKNNEAEELIHRLVIVLINHASCTMTAFQKWMQANGLPVPDGYENKICLVGSTQVLGTIAGQLAECAWAITKYVPLDDDEADDNQEDSGVEDAGSPTDDI